MRFLVRPITILRDFLTWWVAELAALVPEAIRRRFRAVRPILLLETSRQRVRFRLFRGQRCSDLGTVKLSAAGTAEERAEVTAITERVDLRTSDVALRLPADAALRRSLTMPLAAESDLRQAIGFQLDRQTPFSPQEACFDYQVRDRSPARQSLTVDLTVVPRQAVSAALERLEGWGLNADIVDVAGEETDQPPCINLVAEQASAARRSWPRLNAVLGFCALVLLVLAVLAPLAKRHDLAEALQSELAVAKQRADKVMQLNQEIDTLRGHRRFLQEEKRRLPLRIVLLNDLTRILPDNTWVTELRISGKDVRLRGFSSSAASLIGLIDEAPGFVAPRFRSSVKRDQRLGLESFSLSFETLEGQQAL